MMCVMLLYTKCITLWSLLVEEKLQQRIEEHPNCKLPIREGSNCHRSQERAAIAVAEVDLRLFARLAHP